MKFIRVSRSWRILVIVFSVGGYFFYIFLRRWFRVLLVSFILEFFGFVRVGDLFYKSVYVLSLFRDLSGNLVGAYRVVIWLFAEVEVVV